MLRKRARMVTVPILLASLSTLAAAQSQLGDREIWTEEVRPSELVGAKQLVLRSFLVEGPAEAHGPHVTANFKLPPPAASRRIALEAIDRRDKGYALRAAIHCAAPGICGRSWRVDKMRGLGLTAKDLWFTARQDVTSASEGILIPACLCRASLLNERLPVVFSFIPSRALNIRYSIYNETGVLLASQLITNQPAGLPVAIRVMPRGDAQSRLKLVVNHIAASGGSVERFSDSFYFYQM